MVGVGSDVAKMKDKLALLNELIVTLFDYSEENAMASSVPGFKHHLMDLYSPGHHYQHGLELAFCMVTHCYLPKQCVIGAHLWKRSWAKYVRILSSQCNMRSCNLCAIDYESHDIARIHAGPTDCNQLISIKLTPPNHVSQVRLPSRH